MSESSRFTKLFIQLFFIQKNPNPGWWEAFIGSGCALDTEKFFIICVNVIGGCYGSRLVILIILIFVSLSTTCFKTATVFHHVFILVASTVYSD